MGVHLPRVTGACGSLTRGWLMMRPWRITPASPTRTGGGRDAAERGQLLVRRGRRPDVTGRKDGQYISDPEGDRISTISDPAGVVFMGVHLPRVTGACGFLTRGWPMMRLWRHIPGGDTGIGRRPIRNHITSTPHTQHGGGEESGRRPEPRVNPLRSRWGGGLWPMGMPRGGGKTERARQNCRARLILSL